jgi:chitinase
MRLPLVVVLALLSFAAAAAQTPRMHRSPLIVAYVFPQNSTIAASRIDPHAIDRINYAFSKIQDGRMAFASPTDPANFATLTALRRDNPSLTVLVSVGGWLGSGKFSQMALTHRSRAIFIQSVMDFLNLYHLDGLDIDWEYPGQRGSGNPFRAEDKQNYTALLKELRARFSAETKRSGKRLYLTVAAGASDDFLAQSEMKKVAQSVDTVNLMTYDYYEPGSGLRTGHHAPLYRNPADPQGVSGDATVHAFEKAGVPASKILLGIPFYGHVWTHVPDVQHGLYQRGDAPANGSAPFAQIESTMLGHGFIRTWDPVARVPSLYNPASQIFVSYEDAQSAAEKCTYVLNQKLGGVMFWYYGADNGDLLHTLDITLRLP